MRSFWLVSTVLLGLSGCTSVAQPLPENLSPSGPAQSRIATQTPSASEEASSSQVQPAELTQDKSQLANLLELLVIDPEHPAGYDRDLFDHWIDADSDGCNTRREVLIAESLSRVEIASGCDIVGGSWLSVYDSTATNNFSELDIDHMVPLKEAWDSGAHAWDYDTRRRFANDLEFDGSLIAVTASSNRSKSDRDPAQWLPSSSSYLCQYTADWLQVKYRWGLSIDSAESLALGSLVVACDDFPITIPEKATTKVAQAQKPGPMGNDPMFGSCKEAKANGFGPYLKGIDEEYDWYRDGDKDGTVCE